MSFVNLHVHSQYSLLDATLKVEEAVQFAKDNNQGAIALTNHGYMYDFVKQAVACREMGIKSIFGNEIYEVDDDEDKNDTREHSQRRYHVILLAKNKRGLQNLFKIVSYACTTGFYKKPRISIDRIKNNNWGEGIICTSACLAGRLSKLVTNYDIEGAKRWIEKLQSTFDYVAVEIESHDVPQQWEANQRLIEFAQQNSLPITVSCDAHYLKREDMDAHSIFVKISREQEVGETYKDCFLQREEDIYEIMRNYDRGVIKKAIEETEHIASMIEDIDIGLDNDNQMPHINVPEEYENDHVGYLRYLVYSHFDEKFAGMSEEDKQIRRDRIEEEIPVLEYLDYTDYFIMLYMLMKEVHRRKIPVGYARGSASGSLCLYLLGVTQIDSVKWGCLFGRFCSKLRKSLADVDIDLSKDRRDEIIDIAKELFGDENVCPIATFSTFSAKVALSDVGKIYNEDPNSPYYGQIPYAIRTEVTKAIPSVKSLNELGEETDGEVQNLSELLSSNKKLQQIFEEFPLWGQTALKLSNGIKSRGRHAAGTLICPSAITNYMPVCLDNNGNVISQLDWHDAMERLHLQKYDFLGLKTLTVIDKALDYAGLSWDDVDINKLNLYDKEVYDKTYKASETTAVFQFESLEGKKMCAEAEVSTPEGIFAVNAGNRPGCKALFPEYVHNKEHPDDVKLIHPDLKKILWQSEGCIFYQEQVMALFSYAGFDDGETDNCRRAVAKGHKELMLPMHDRFIEGLLENGWTQKQADDMWDLIVAQSNYLFNFSHACAYGLLSYLTAWLKVHYPVAYMSACMSCDADNPTRLTVLINETKRLGIRVLPPNINKSNRDFTPLPDRNSILFGLLAIKGLGEKVVDEIIANRPYKSFDEFLSYNINKTAVISLIKAGCFTVSKKEQLLESYFNRLVPYKEYKDVTSLPSKTELLMKWGINTDNYKTKNKLNKEALTRDYNLARRIQFESSEKERHTKELQTLKDKYAQDPWLWEFDLLGLFLTSDPLEFAYDKIRDFETIDNDTDAVLIGVIVGIQRKKDRHNQLFCYIQLYTDNNIREAICWASTTKQYLNLIKNGNCVAIYGRKTEGGNIIVNEMKDYRDWLRDKNLKHKGVNA